MNKNDVFGFSPLHLKRIWRILDGVDGLDFNPNSDVDVDLITVGVTGSPRVYWDESEDQFRSTKGWIFDAPCDVQGVWVATAAWTLPAFTGGGDIFVNDALGIVIGHTARQTSVLGNDYLTQILGTGAIDTGLLIARYSADASGPDLVLAKSRHATILSHTVPSLNDLIGRILFCPSNATNFNDAGAYIAAYCDGASGAGDLPTRLVFFTAADGSATPTERLRITAAGNLEINSTACVTSFGPAAVASITVKNGLITAIS